MRSSDAAAAAVGIFTLLLDGELEEAEFRLLMRQLLGEDVSDWEDVVIALGAIGLGSMDVLTDGHPEVYLQALGATTGDLDNDEGG